MTIIGIISLITGAVAALYSAYHYGRASAFRESKKTANDAFDKGFGHGELFAELDVKPPSGRSIMDRIKQDVAGCLALLIVALAASDASACRFCNRTPCIYAHQAIAVAPVAVVPPTFVSVQNNYPPPNGAQNYGLLAPQGNTQFAVGQPYTLQDLMRANQATDDQRLHLLATMYSQLLPVAHATINGVTNLSGLKIAADHHTQPPLIQSTAVKTILDASGVHPAAQQFRQQQQAWKFSIGADGQPRIEQLQPEQVNTVVRQSIDVRSGPPLPPVPGLDANSAIAQKCVSCHGATKAERGLSFADLSKIDCKIAKLSMKHVRSGYMPKGVPLQPGEKEQLLGELEVLGE